MTKKNAPTTKVENNIEQGLTFEFGDGTILSAGIVHAAVYEVYNPKTGETEYEVGPQQYLIASHNGLMPAFNSETYDTLQELANAMRDHADLRTWKRSS